MKNLKLSTVLAFALISIGSLDTSAQTNNAATPYGSVASIYQRDVLDGYFYRAKINWANLDDEYAAKDIRKAAAFVEIVINVDPQSKDLLKPFKLLKQTETEMAAGRIVTLYQLQAVFAETHAFLADFQLKSSDILRRQKHEIDSTRALRLAYHHLFHAITWSGIKLDYAKFSKDYYKGGKKATWRENRNALEKILNSQSPNGQSEMDKKAIIDAAAFLEFGIGELKKNLNSRLW